MKNLKRNCHNEASLFKASCGYLMRLPRHFVPRNDSSRGAMFGLDARIALAIFGALSVISGAALYSAIQNAKATAVLADLNEIGKAWEQYYLDTGVTLSQSSIDSSADSFYRLKTADLVSKPVSVTGWRGPYLNYTVSGDFLRFPDAEDLHILVLDNAWVTSAWSDGKCVSGKLCNVWVYINGFDGSEENTIDDIVDGGDGGSAGNFRFLDSGHATYKHSYILKIAPRKNPND